MGALAVLAGALPAWAEPVPAIPPATPIPPKAPIVPSDALSTFNLAAESHDAISDWVLTVPYWALGIVGGLLGVALLSRAGAHGIKALTRGFR